MNVGDRIKKLRESKEIERNELAKKIGITYHALAKYEINERQPDYETLGKFADFFDVSTDFLLGRTKTPKYTTHYVTPKEFFPPMVAEEMEKYAEYIEVFKEKKYTPAEVAEVADFIRKHSK